MPAFPPGLTTSRERRLEEEAFFRMIGLGKPVIAKASRRAEIAGTSIENELLAAGQLEPATYYETLAAILDLPYLREIPPETVVVSRHVDAVLRRPRWLRIETCGMTKQVVAPTAGDLTSLKALLCRKPGVRNHLVVAAPHAIRRAVWACRADQRARETVRALFEHSADDSARIVATGRQGFMFGALSSLLLLAIVAAPGAFLSAIHPLLTVVFLACIVLRVAPLAVPENRISAIPAGITEGKLPVYTVVVALYREAAVVEQLVCALSRLRWPRTRLEIKLICESDDHATLAALASMTLPPEYEIIRVPPIGPRTKPKALHYALAGARGDFLVIYDAEDRPQPDQLLEAYAAFARNEENVAYLQAPLIVSNARQSSIAALFALEYAGLFRGLLPFLARTGLPLPLGGTSNHFRMKALRDCGAWDPHNVTEDADLGMRLYRRGYRGAVLERYTLEAAPERPAVWMRQRTRWFKGWMQTWLVMMRKPRCLLNEMGARGFIAFQIVIAGMLLSSLGHPLLFVFVIHAAIAALNGSRLLDTPIHQLLFGLDLTNLIGGYLAFVLLARRSMIAEEWQRIGLRWLWVPIYWVGMSLAAWRAVGELLRAPFYWAKTPHCAENTRETADSTKDNAGEPDRIAGETTASAV